MPTAGRGAGDRPSTSDCPASLPENGGACDGLTGLSCDYDAMSCRCRHTEPVWLCEDKGSGGRQARSPTGAAGAGRRTGRGEADAGGEGGRGSGTMGDAGAGGRGRGDPRNGDGGRGRGRP
jgi:hypothetical protein